MSTTFKKHANNAVSSLASGIDGDDLSLTVATGEGALFPAASPFWVTVWEDETADGEIILCDSTAGDVITVNSGGRGAQGTSAGSWTAGAKVALLITAGAFDQIATAINALEGGSGLGSGVVTYAKIQNVSATDKVLGRSSSGAGVVQEITCTAAGRALIDDADAAAQRTTLGGVAVGASSSTDNALPRFDGTGGKTLQGSSVVVDDSNNLTGVASLAMNGFFDIGGPQAVTISGGSVTITKSFINVDTEGAASTDDLDTIVGVATSRWLVLRIANTGRHVVLKNGGNIVIPGGDYEIAATGDVVLLFAINSSNFYVLNRVGG